MNGSSENKNMWGMRTVKKIIPVFLVLVLLLLPMVSAWSLGGWFKDFFRGAGTPVLVEADKVSDKADTSFEPQGLEVAKPLTKEEVEQWHPAVFVQTVDDGWAYEVWVNGELYVKKKIQIAPPEIKAQAVALYHEPVIIDGEPVVWE